MVYTLMEALWRLGLKGTVWAEAQVDTICLKLLKIGAIVRVSVRRVLLQLSLRLSLEGSLLPSLPRSALLNTPQTTVNPTSTFTDLSSGAEPCPEYPHKHADRTAQGQILPAESAPSFKNEHNGSNRGCALTQISTYEKSRLVASTDAGGCYGVPLSLSDS